MLFEKETNIINCKKIAENMLKEFNDKIEKYKTLGTPGLAFITFGKKESAIYFNKTQSYCKKLNINIFNYNYDNNILQEEICKIIEKLNNNNQINGIILQSPLPNHLDKNLIYNTIVNNKDIEGLNNYNSGCLINNLNKNSFFIPCTPLACMEIIKNEKIDLKGKKITIIGKSNIVGLPLSILLLQNNATLTVCHIDTIDLISHVKQADILITACGQPKMIKKYWLKDNAIVIDIGINVIYDESYKNGYYIVGDTDYDDVKEIVSKITPVPNGVGLITTMMLISNILKSFEIQNNIINK
jgi:5,10-methylene-tetrahydrofolate dehydrogenase/methenyl tetrahydrofolate cyclohydrolase